MFHLLSHTDGSGGESLFVDGQAAATYLQENHPSLHIYLHRQKILFHASGNAEVGELGNNTISPEGNVVLLGGKTIAHPSDEETSGYKSDKTTLGGVRTHIRWNNDDRDTQLWRSLESIERWYRAAREWTRILKMKEFEIKVQLKPGQPIIFDNWRYLHGRTAFSGNRRICGGYSTSSLQNSSFVCHPLFMLWHTRFPPSPRTKLSVSNLISWNQNGSHELLLPQRQGHKHQLLSGHSHSASNPLCRLRTQ